MPKGIYRHTLLLIPFLALLPAISYADVSKIVFTTDTQTVQPYAISGPISIQAQDSSGNSSPTSETIDLEFLSTSPSGEFLGSTGNPATKTMNTNTANRTIYYRDSAEGTFTITINAKGRESSKNWSVNQSITVSSSITTATTSTGNTTTTNTNTSSSPSSSSATSGHYSATPVTELKSTVKLEASAGRNRIGAVGTPLEFQADINNEYLKNTNFEWSMGDGTFKRGIAVTHSYMYPGEYVVVLNIKSPNGNAVTRTNVKIIPTDLSVTEAISERIEVTNNSKGEINLYGRALVTISGNKTFIFPQDTIIMAGQKISFSATVTGLTPNNLADAYLIIVGTNPNNVDVVLKISEQRLGQIASITNKVTNLQQELSVIAEEEKVLAATTTEEILVVETPKELVSKNLSQTAQTYSATNDIEEQGIIKSWLAILKRFFLRKQ